jgi:trehalose 6-phosphate phosphatase
VPPPASAGRSANPQGPLGSLRGLLPRAGIFLDFDGTLSEIAPRPDAAHPVAGADDVLPKLAARCAVVALVSGRPSAEVRSMLDVPGVVVLGHYGLESPDPAGHDDDLPEVRAAVARAASGWPGVRIEDKGRSVAVHFREAERPDDAAEALRPALDRIAAERGLLVLPGKMVLELAPAETPGKGAVVAREVRARDLRACLFAGDDVADLAAFSALDELAAEGVVAVKIAVDGPETPSELRAAADEVVDGPTGLVRLLERLAG